MNERKKEGGNAQTGAGFSPMVMTTDEDLSLGRSVLERPNRMQTLGFALLQPRHCVPGYGDAMTIPCLYPDTFLKGPCHLLASSGANVHN